LSAQYPAEGLSWAAARAGTSDPVAKGISAPPSNKPQIDKDRIGGSLLGLVADPLLNQRQTVGGLMNVVTVGDITECSQDLLQAFQPGAERLSRGCGATEILFYGSR
jgi:hypothetical protein